MSEQKPGESQSQNTGNHRERRRGRRGPFGGLFWGLLLILIGVLFFAQNQAWIPEDTWWQWFLVGLGLILLVEALVRYNNAEYRITALSRVIAGIALVIVGAAFLIGFSQWWPLVLIAVGVAILIAFWQRRT